MASTIIAVASPLLPFGGVQEVHAQGAPAQTSPAQTSPAKTAPAKGECMKQLQPPLTEGQKAEMVKIKQEKGDKKEKLKQFIMTLSPDQQAQLKACKKAQKK